MRGSRLPQDPTVCLANPHDPYHHVPTNPQGAGVLAAVTGQVTLRQCSTHEQPPQTRTAWAWPLPPAPASLRRATPQGQPATPGIRGLMEMSSLERR